MGPAAEWGIGGPRLYGVRSWQCLPCLVVQSGSWLASAKPCTAPELPKAAGLLESCGSGQLLCLRGQPQVVVCSGWLASEGLC